MSDEDFQKIAADIKVAPTKVLLLHGLVFSYELRALTPERPELLPMIRAELARRPVATQT